MYKTKTVSEGTWIVSERTELDELIIAEGASVAAPEGKFVVMTIYGVGFEIKPGTYRGDILLDVADYYMMEPCGLYSFSEKRFPLTAAIVIYNGKYDPARSIPGIVQYGEVTDKYARDITILAKGKNFNGIIIDGDSEYTIDNLRLMFEGDADNDFVGQGTGVTCVGKSKVTINNSDIMVVGVSRCAMHNGGHSEVHVNNTRIEYISPETTRNLHAKAWNLAIEGSGRAVQHCDWTTAYYDNCYVRSSGWGLLSVDGADYNRLMIKNSTLDMIGPRTRGYGTFAMGDAFTSFDHCTVNVNGYPMLIQAFRDRGLGEEYPTGGEFINGCVVNARLYGTVIQRQNHGPFTVRDSTFYSEKASVVVKGSNSFITFERAHFYPKNGTILQLMDNDDIAMDADFYDIPLGETDVRDPARDLTVADPERDVFLEVRHMEAVGNFFNSTTALSANTRNRIKGWQNMEGYEDLVLPDEGIEDGFAREQQGVKTLDMKLIDAHITGIISAAGQAYKEGLSRLEETTKFELSNVTQWAAPAINNGVILSLDGDSRWTVTGTSYLTKLELAEGSVVSPEEGKSLVFSVDGIPTELRPGEYAGEIVLEVQ